MSKEWFWGIFTFDKKEKKEKNKALYSKCMAVTYHHGVAFWDDL